MERAKTSQKRGCGWRDEEAFTSREKDAPAGGTVCVREQGTAVSGVPEEQGPLRWACSTKWGGPGRRVLEPRCSFPSLSLSPASRLPPHR